MVVAGVGVALIIAAIAWYGAMQPATPEAPTPQKGLPNAKHAGDPEFDKYSGLVVLVNKKFFTQGNLLGQKQALIQGEIANFSDRPVVGIELRGTVYGTGGTVLATALALPVPKKFDQIPAKGQIPFAVTVDGVPRDGQIDDITIQIEGLEMGQ